MATSALIIRFTKISPTHHRFEYIRLDGTGEKLELDTKTFLFHDLLHFAVESRAKLSNSFYGLLARQNGYADFSKEDRDLSRFGPEAIGTEHVVGPMTGVIKGEVTPRELIVGASNIFEAYQQSIPAWLTEEFVLGIKEDMRKLQGYWNGTPFGTTMELRFLYSVK